MNLMFKKKAKVKRDYMREYMRARRAGRDWEKRGLRRAELRGKTLIDILIIIFLITVLAILGVVIIPKLLGY